MFLRRGRRYGYGRSLLHACGDVSSNGGILSGTNKFAPRMWRCFQTLRQVSEVSPVCSTHVETFPEAEHMTVSMKSLLYVCGGISSSSIRSNRNCRLAPLTWRFYYLDKESQRIQIISRYQNPVF